MINGHTSEIVCCEVVAKLWNEYLKNIEDGVITLKKDQPEESEGASLVMPTWLGLILLLDFSL